MCLNETLLDESVTDIQLGGYTLVSRRDRDDGRGGGDIAVFALIGFAEQVIFRMRRADHERSWQTLLTDVGPILCCVWYRPPCPGKVASIRGCEEQFRKLSDEHVATVIIGDLNVHHKRWLRYSSSVSVEGTALLRFCMATGLRQHVKEPTREEYLLDLVISDVNPRLVEVLPAISGRVLFRRDGSGGHYENKLRAFEG